MKQSSKARTVALWIVLVLICIVFLQLLDKRGPDRYEDFQTFLEHVETKQVASVRVHNNEIHVLLLRSREAYTTLGVANDELIQTLSDQGVPVSWGEEKKPLRALLLTAVPLLLILLALIFFVKKAGGGTANIMSLGKSKARLIPNDSAVTFSDIGGCVEAKEQFTDVIHFLKDPKKWKEAGARLPRGVLLVGPPGCGKTLLARAVAGETKARFYSVSASEFVEMFVGVGAARIRDMFETAAKTAPSVIFIDELDAVGRRRGSGIGAGHDEREQTLNQLLVCMDGFTPLQQIVVLAATNRPDTLDKALTRPGRFDKSIKIPELTEQDRVDILTIHTKDKPLDQNISLKDLASKITGFNGSQIESLANEAALLAVRRAVREGHTSAEIATVDFEEALSQSKSDKRLFNRLDSVLIESSTQLSEPAGKAVTRLTLKEETTLEGEVIWADAAFIKVKELENGTETVVPKIQITKIQTLEGTEAAELDDLVQDCWQGKQPDMA